VKKKNKNQNLKAEKNRDKNAQHEDHSKTTAGVTSKSKEISTSPYLDKVK